MSRSIHYVLWCCDTGLVIGDLFLDYSVLIYWVNGGVLSCCFFFQAEDGLRDLVRSRGLGDVYKRQA